ncbi:MAG: HIT family protein [Candidatus Nanohaloarchaea archaeon]|nr:HIT family protein [Candidatus Nanohaloarchaea archaeon]
MEHQDPGDCPFCQIIDGKLESYTVYEDEDALAFLDVNPVSRGHTLVVPKVQAATLDELDGGETSALFNAVRKVESAVEEGLEPDGVNVLQSNGEAAGQEVFHVHVHVIPRYGEDGLEFSFETGELGEGEARNVLEELEARG